MTKKLSLVCFLVIAGSLACGGDPAHESGQPDDRPEPKTADEAMAQQADKQERQKALRDKGPCTPAAIREALEPDERFWHCRGEDWTGTTQIKDKLAELASHPAGYKAACDELWDDPLGMKRAMCDEIEE